MSPSTKDWQVIRKHIKEAEDILINDFLEDLDGFELKRYSDMMRTLKSLREKYKKKLKE